MSEGLAGKVAIVTGAARGLGRAIALRLARAGADVAIVDLDLLGAKRWNEELSAATVPDEIRAMGRRSTGVQADLSTYDSAIEAITTAVGEMGRVDILVNTAGGMVTDMATSFASTSSAQDMQTLIAVNYASAVHCSQAAVAAMRRQGGGGAIVNTSSIASTHSLVTGALAHYGAAKAALSSYTRALASEVGPDGIRVNAVVPGRILTARIASVMEARGTAEDDIKSVPLRRFGQPEDVAKAVEFLAGEMSAYITGQCLVVDGGATLSAA